MLSCLPFLLLGMIHIAAQRSQSRLKQMKSRKKPIPYLNRCLNIEEWRFTAIPVNWKLCNSRKKKTNPNLTFWNKLKLLLIYLVSRQKKNDLNEYIWYKPLSYSQLILNKNLFLFSFPEHICTPFEFSRTCFIFAPI